MTIPTQVFSVAPLADVKDAILKRFRLRLHALKSPLVASKQIDDELAIQVHEILDAVFRNLVTGSGNSFSSPQAEIDKPDAGAVLRSRKRQAAQGIHPTDNMTAAAALFEIVLSETQTGDGIWGKGNDVARALQQVIMVHVDPASALYVSILLDRLSAAHIEERRSLSQELHDRIAILIWTVHGDRVLERQLLRSSSAGFISKSVDAERLIDIIREVCGSYQRPEPSAGCSEQQSQRRILTTRELEVLRMIAQAFSNRDISRQLHITEGTVKRHATNVYAKLGATSRIDAVRKATGLGLLR